MATTPTTRSRRPTAAQSSATSPITDNISVTGSQPQIVKQRSIEPTHADIAARAYEIFLARNGAEGDPTADWLQAERELRGRAGLTV